MLAHTFVMLVKMSVVSCALEQGQASVPALPLVLVVMLLMGPHVLLVRTDYLVALLVLLLHPARVLHAIMAMFWFPESVKLVLPTAKLVPPVQEFLPAPRAIRALLFKMDNVLGVA